MSARICGPSVRCTRANQRRQFSRCGASPLGRATAPEHPPWRARLRDFSKHAGESGKNFAARGGAWCPLLGDQRRRTHGRKTSRRPPKRQREVGDLCQRVEQRQHAGRRPGRCESMISSTLALGLGLPCVGTPPSGPRGAHYGDHGDIVSVRVRRAAATRGSGIAGLNEFTGLCLGEGGRARGLLWQSDANSQRAPEFFRTVHLRGHTPCESGTTTPPAMDPGTAIRRRRCRREWLRDRRGRGRAIRAAVCGERIAMGRGRGPRPHRSMAFVRVARRRRSGQESWARRPGVGGALRRAAGTRGNARVAAIFERRAAPSAREASSNRMPAHVHWLLYIPDAQTAAAFRSVYCTHDSSRWRAGPVGRLAIPRRHFPSVPTARPQAVGLQTKPSSRLVPFTGG